MSNNTVTYKVFESIVNALKPLGTKVYLMNRPTATKTLDDKFVVIDLPTQFRHQTFGNDDFCYELTGVIYTFCRAHSDGTPNIDQQTKFTRSVMELFPYSDEILECTRPRMLLRGLDDYGFQLTTITFNIRTKYNAFQNL